ncbi:hypothetical protein Cgig2_027520 [Carnegiea gigantea]|uniref:Cytochrome P450 n=2 Tax=Carnegiea gigantea TaxID=171969 RepID=A0A9Q1GLZ6_9CARY|nr:hypothetical protein Cgig2_027520 [Carnegiea gigantea]
MSKESLTMREQYGENLIVFKVMFNEAFFVSRLCSLNWHQDLFTAGTDTTAITLEWAMTELLRHSEKIMQASAEIDQVLGQGRSIKEYDISNLPYAQAIVKEILRLHPPAPFWYHIRPRAMYNYVAIIFLDSEIDLRGRNFELMPFGTGRRMCPGMLLGPRMVHPMLATLLHSVTSSHPTPYMRLA